MTHDRQVPKNFSGDIDGVSLIDLVQWVCTADMSRNIYLESASGTGIIAIRSGQVVSAVAGDVSGERTLMEVLTWSEGSFRCVAEGAEIARNIRKSWEQLLIEALQYRTELPQAVSVPASGFAGSLAGIDLFDLVHLACMTNTPRDVWIDAGRFSGLFCFREGRVTDARSGDLTGETAFREMMLAGTGSFKALPPGMGETVTISEPFEQLLAGAMHYRRQAAGVEGVLDEEMTFIQKMERMKMSEKIKMALTGNRETRSLLMRENNRMVQLAVVGNARLSESEVALMAANKQMDEEVLRKIANNREWMRLHQVRAALVKNPKCPLAISTRLVPTLGPLDWKNIAVSKSVPGAISQTAKRLIVR